MDRNHFVFCICSIINNYSDFHFKVYNTKFMHRQSLITSVVTMCLPGQANSVYSHTAKVTSLRWKVYYCSFCCLVPRWYLCMLSISSKGNRLTRTWFAQMYLSIVVTNRQMFFYLTLWRHVCAYITNIVLQLYLE